MASKSERRKNHTTQSIAFLEWQSKVIITIVLKMVMIIIIIIATIIILAGMPFELDEILRNLSI